MLSARIPTRQNKLSPRVSGLSSATESVALPPDRQEHHMPEFTEHRIPQYRAYFIGSDGHFIDEGQLSAYRFGRVIRLCLLLKVTPIGFTSSGLSPGQAIIRRIW